MQDTSFIRKDINSAVKPNDDFYEYAVGNWLKNNSIPDDYSRWGAFDILIEENYQKLKKLAEGIDEFENSSLAPLAKLVKVFYLSGLDEKKCEEQGITPITSYLNKIDEIVSLDDVTKIAAELHMLGGKPFFFFGSTPDSKNSEQVIAGLAQGGLGLPERDYYISEDIKIKEVREKYKQHITKMFGLIGRNELVKDAAEIILRIETELAEMSRTKETLRDPVANYNKMNLTELTKSSSYWPWKTYFEAMKLHKIDEIDVGQPEFFVALGNFLHDVPLSDIKVYLTWHLLLATADYLTDALGVEKFHFYGQIIQGKPKQSDRWKRVIMSIDNHIGQAIGQLYVQKYFSKSVKGRAEELVKNIVVEMGERIKQLDWMSENTKQEALNKLDGIKVKIGYPDWWIDYSGLEFLDNSYASVVIAAKKFEFYRDCDKIGKPVNHAEWFIPPQMVNAFYNSLDNEIVFPSGILQPPFFFAEADDALNYGGIGVVIGHEITHGFDDSGRQYDAVGNLRDWWTEEDKRKFSKLTKKLVEQFNAEKVLGESVNGAFTLGENIADLGGLYVSYSAFIKTLQGKSKQLIDGFTPEQRFFVSYARCWKQIIRPEKALLLLKIDPHAPCKYRNNIPFSNFPPFYEAFDVKRGDAMWRDENERVVIW